MPASLTIENINTLIAEIGPKAIDDAVSRSSKLWNLVRKLDAMDAEGARWKVKVSGNSSAAAASPGGDLSAASAATFVDASLLWANYPVVFSVSHQGLKQMEKAAQLGQSLANMLALQLEDAAKDLVNAVNTDMISGDGTSGALVGLCTAIDDTGTYAGIARGTYSEWACYVAHNSGTPRTLTEAIMSTAYDYALDTTKIKAGNWAILCGSAQHKTMAGFSTGAATGYVNPVDGKMTQILGKADVIFRGIPAILIPGWTAGRIDFVNLDAVEMHCMNGAEQPFVFNGGVESANTDAIVFKGFFNGALVLRDPKHNAFSIQDLS
jgi:hypothetical protein